MRGVYCEVIKECGYHDDHEVGEMILVAEEHLHVMLEAGYIKVISYYATEPEESKSI